MQPQLRDYGPAGLLRSPRTGAGRVASAVQASLGVRDVPIYGRPGLMARRIALAYLDVVGFSRMMCTDEDGTLTRWLAIRRNILEPKVKMHRGRLVNAVGDSVLVEFGNAADALSWSLDVQHAMEDRNAVDEGPLFELRIAVHACHVIVLGESLYGIGINLAARLQNHAPPGRVIVSETVYEDLGPLADAKAVGPLLLKNMPRPVCAYVL